MPNPDIADAQFDGAAGSPKAPSFGKGVYHEAVGRGTSNRIHEGHRATERDAAVRDIWLKIMKGMKLKKEIASQVKDLLKNAHNWDNIYKVPIIQDYM